MLPHYFLNNVQINMARAFKRATMHYHISRGWKTMTCQLVKFCNGYALDIPGNRKIMIFSFWPYGAFNISTSELLLIGGFQLSTSWSIYAPRSQFPFSSFPTLPLLVWKQLQNFIVFKVKKEFTSTKHTQKLFWYLKSRFDVEPPKIGYFQISKPIFVAKCF